MEMMRSEQLKSWLSWRWWNGWLLCLSRVLPACIATGLDLGPSKAIQLSNKRNQLKRIVMCLKSSWAHAQTLEPLVSVMFDVEMVLGFLRGRR